MSTYPYLPGLPDDEDEDSASAIGRKRLALFSRHKRSHPNSSDAKVMSGQKEKGGRDGDTKGVSGQKEKGGREGQASTPGQKGGTANSVSGACQKEKAGYGGMSNAVQKEKGRDGYGGITNSTGGLLGYGMQQGTVGPGGKMGGMQQASVGPGGKTATRSDVKETLKSMGLRCEDFTISVYSREQAHAILRRQGVEVTPNNVQSRERMPGMTGRGGVKNVRSAEGTRMSHNMRAGNVVNPRNVNARYSSQEEDDDDCVILDPPDAPKSVPKLPQQFQLMGTTVQVNRGAKRPSRPMANQPQAKRSNARPMMYYRKEHESEYGSEASVQDTLKRLKNYNISITCRRNTSGIRPHGGMMDSESDMENDSHLDSDDDGEDMSKYLDCQIGEIDEMPEEEIFEDEDFDEIDDDKNDADYNPRGKKRKQKSKSPRKGKKAAAASSSASTAVDRSSKNPGMDEMPDMVPNIELGELSDQHGSNLSENEYDHDPLGEENEDIHQQLRDMENAAEPQEEDEQNENANPEDEMEEEQGEQTSMEEEPMEEQPVEENVENPDNSEEKEADTSNEENQENIEGDYTETDKPAPSAAEEINDAPEEEEEIDEELEKELLGEDLGNGEEGAEEDL